MYLNLLPHKNTMLVFREIKEGIKKKIGVTQIFERFVNFMSSLLS